MTAGGFQTSVAGASTSPSSKLVPEGWHELSIGPRILLIDNDPQDRARTAWVLGREALGDAEPDTVDHEPLRRHVPAERSRRIESAPNEPGGQSILFVALSEGTGGRAPLPVNEKRQEGAR